MDAALLINPEDTSLGKLYFVTAAGWDDDVEFHYFVWAKSRSDADHKVLRFDGAAARVELALPIAQGRPDSLYEDAEAASRDRGCPFIIRVDLSDNALRVGEF